MNAPMGDRPACRKYFDWATSPVGGVEPPEVLSRHIEGCNDCMADFGRIGAEAERISGILEDRREIDLPAGFAERVMGSLVTPSWQIRQPRIWVLPAGLLALFGVSAAALLHPLPAGLAERSMLFSMFRAPLETIGEVARVIGRGVAILSESATSISGLPHSGGALLALFGALLAGAAARRLAAPIVSVKSRLD